MSKKTAYMVFIAEMKGRQHIKVSQQQWREGEKENPVWQEMADKINNPPPTTPTTPATPTTPTAPTAPTTPTTPATPTTQYPEAAMVEPLKGCVPKVLEQVHPDVTASEKVVNYVAQLLSNFVYAINLRLEITKDPAKALEQVMRGSLRAHADSEGRRTVEGRYEFGVHRFLDHKDLPVRNPYIAGVTEYLCAEIMELAGSVAIKGKKTVITVDHVRKGIEGDEELRVYF